MRILSLNAWGGTLAGPLLDYLRSDPPEVICLQEIVHSPGSDAETLTYRDGDHVLPQRANLLRDLRRALPDHAATFCPAARGDLWDGPARIDSFWGLATFVSDRLPVIAQVQGFVFKAYSANGYGDHPRSRSAHALRLHDPATGRMITVAQMHGLRDPRGKVDTPDRRAQVHRLLDLSRQVSAPGDLRVICGDFNVEPDSETLRLMQAEGFTELVTAGNHPGTRTSHYPKPGRFADYMLIDDPAAVVRFDVVRDPEVSDHCPLLLEV